MRRPIELSAPSPASPPRLRLLRDDEIPIRSRMLVLLTHYGGDSLGALIAGLVADPRWAELQELPVGGFFVADGAPLASALPPVAPPPAVEAPPSSIEAPVAASEAPPPAARPVADALPAIPPAPPEDEPIPEDLAAAVKVLEGLLGIEEPRALKELWEVVPRAGIPVCRAAYRKTTEIEAAGGIVRDGYRKSPGGVFFYLIKTRAGRELLGPEFAKAAVAPVAPVQSARNPVSRPAQSAPSSSPPAAAPSTPAVTRLAPASSRRRVPVEAPPVVAASPAVAAPPAATPGRRTGDVVAAMLEFIALHPGLREDEIRARLGGDRMLIRATLNALRAQRRVRTTGVGRTMTYAPIG